MRMFGGIGLRRRSLSPPPPPTTSGLRDKLHCAARCCNGIISPGPSRGAGSRKRGCLYLRRMHFRSRWKFRFAYKWASALLIRTPLPAPPFLPGCMQTGCVTLPLQERLSSCLYKNASREPLGIECGDPSVTFF